MLIHETMLAASERTKLCKQIKIICVSEEASMMVIVLDIGEGENDEISGNFILYQSPTLDPYVIIMSIVFTLNFSPIRPNNCERRDIGDFFSSNLCTSTTWWVSFGEKGYTYMWWKVKNDGEPRTWMRFGGSLGERVCVGFFCWLVFFR